MSKSKRKLTPRQTIFVDEYLKKFNATDAARRAGFSDGSYGRTLVHLPEIQHAIVKRQELAQLRTSITVETVINELAVLHAKCVESGDNSTAARCLELLGKHVGAFQAGHQEKGTKVIVNMNFSAPNPVIEAVIIEDIDN